MIAAQEGWLDIVRIFIEWNASLDQRDDEGRTALIFVSEEIQEHLTFEHGEIVTYLLEQGANVHIRTDYNTSVLTTLLSALHKVNQGCFRSHSLAGIISNVA